MTKERSITQLLMAKSPGMHHQMLWKSTLNAEMNMVKKKENG